MTAIDIWKRNSKWLLSAISSAVSIVIADLGIVQQCLPPSAGTMAFLPIGHEH